MRSLALALGSILIIFSLASPARALVELRAGYGLLASNPEDINKVDVKLLSGFHVDALVSLPMVPIGFGLRYESMTMENDGTVLGQKVNVDLDYERISLLINKRLIDTLLYVGAIGSLGLSNKATSKVSISGASLEKKEYDEGLTFSLGAEAGVGFGLFLVGAELGYQLGELKDDKDNKFDTDGFYFKAMVGVGF